MANVNIKLTKEQQQYLVAAILFFGGGGYAYFKYFWIPTSTKIAETQEKIEEVRGKIEKAQRQASRRDQLKKDLERLKEEELEAEKRLPRNKDLPAVINTLSALSTRYDVSLLSFTPGTTSAKQYFTELSYTLNIKGTYHDTAKFFAAIALEERIFNVRGVTYGSPDETGKLSVSFTLISYQYRG